MHLFEITGPGIDRVSVFARTYDEAVGVFTASHLARGGLELTRFDVGLKNAAWPGQNIKHLQDALALGLIGVGRYNPDTGWIIGDGVSLEEDA